VCLERVSWQSATNAPHMTGLADAVPSGGSSWSGKRAPQRAAEPRHPLQRGHWQGGHSVVIRGLRPSAANTTRSGPQVCPESRETRRVNKGRSARNPDSLVPFTMRAHLYGADADQHLRRIRHCNRAWTGHSRGAHR
jgi:hypothetical protein